MRARSAGALADTQMERPEIPVAINRAGVRGLKKLLRVPDRELGSQTTMADVSLAVDLAPNLKGTHMSRFVEALESFEDVLDANSLRRLLQDLRRGLFASASFAHFQFPFLARKKSPATGLVASVASSCVIRGELDDSGLDLVLEIATPVMTVCPCSLAISEVGAHGQRALARLELGVDKIGWLEDFIEISEASSSCAVYSLLKREDEKMVTEMAFARPMFVEDVARHVSHILAARSGVKWFKVDVESQESIHGHNAFASISMDKRSK